MKKNIFITLLLALIFSFHHASAEETFNASGEFKVKLPDGLYLYQPKIMEEVFSPLFIVEKGALVDPYALAAGIGKEKFIRDYVDGKRFHVYIEGVPTGILTAVKFEFVKGCDSDAFLPDIRGKGKYEGKPLKEAYSNKSLYASDEHDRFYGSLKAIAASVELTLPKTLKNYEVAEEDKTMVIEAVRKHFVPEMFERIKERLKTLHEEKQVIVGDKRSRLDSINALDFDGNGKKDLIGIYDYTITYTSVARNDEMVAVFPASILFAVFNNGDAIERIAFAEGYEPAFSLGGIIDIDGVETPELVLQESVTSGEDEDPDEGRQVAIFQRTSAGWKETYRTGKICGPIF